MLLIEPNTDSANWLREVHGIDIPEQGIAVLTGNEDWPNFVKVYDRNHIASGYTRYAFDNEGKAFVAYYKSGIPESV